MIEKKLDFKTFWNHDNKKLYANGVVLVNALIKTGAYTEDQAVEFVNKFQNDSFISGEHDEAFNNCGPEA